MQSDGLWAAIWTVSKSLADKGEVVISSKDKVQHSYMLGHPWY